MRVEGNKLIVNKKDLCEEDFKIDKVNLGVSEAEVDTKVKNTLVALGYNDNEVKIHKTGLSKIDMYIPSKTPGGAGTGELDVSIIIDGELKLIIEDKEPLNDKSHSAEKALEEAKYYANELRKYDNDVRIIVGYNGLNFKLQVFDRISKGWVPFLINGVELDKFPSRKIVELIYNNNITSIIIKEKDDIEINQSKQVKAVMEALKVYYRHISFLQNNTQKSVDFTVSFIALKSMLEKYQSKINATWTEIGETVFKIKENEDRDKYIKRCINTLKSGKFENSELKVALQAMKEKINSTKNLLIESDEIEDSDKILDEIFVIKDGKKKDKKTFDFEDEIKQFKDLDDLIYLALIYFELSSIHDLHSSSIDLFGEVYEILSDKTTKKNFGEFFTRRHIIKALINLFYEDEIENILGRVELVDGVMKSTSPKSICDPACGTGGFLTESFKYVYEYIRTSDEWENFDFSDLARKAFYGYDINGANVGRTKINMYLAGDGFSEIEQLNTLTSSKLNNKKFNYIVTNVPYGKGNNIIKMYDEDVNSDTNRNNVENGNKRLEVNFLIKVVKMLEKNGKGLIIIPDGIFEAPSLSYLREWLIKNCKIEKVIGLPKHVFAPYTHEKTYALYIKKRNRVLTRLEEASNEQVWMYIIDNDGYANSDKRFRTDNVDSNNRWLNDEVSAWITKDGVKMPSLLEERWNLKSHDDNEVFTDEWGKEIKGRKYGYVKMKEIFEDEITTFKTLPISEVLLKINTIEKEALITSKDKLYSNDYEIKEEIAEILSSIGIEFKDDKFYDKNKPIKEIIRIAEFKEIAKKYDKKLKSFKDILKDDGISVKDEYIDIAEKEELEINLEKGIKIYKSNNISYKEINEEKILELLNKKVLSNLTKKDDLFKEEDGVKILEDRYKYILERENITYDSFEGEFYDESIELVKKILILIPERYFRNSLEEHLNLDEFNAKNNKLLKDAVKEILYKDDNVDEDVFNIISEMLKEIKENKVSLEIGGESNESES